MHPTVETSIPTHYAISPNMCGRYQLQVSCTALQTARSNTVWRQGHDMRHVQRQEVRPTTTAPVLVAAAGLPPPTESAPLPAELVIMQWGFKQARPAQQPSLPPLINARSETVLQLPTFRRLLFHRLGSRRCAVPITGFFEWHRSAPPGKPILTPYLVTRTSVSPAVAYLAGLYDDAAPPSTVQGQEGGDVTPRAYDAFVILTIAAVPEMRWLHARQPIFLHTERDLASWLHHGVTPCDAVAALAPETGLVSTRMLKDLSAPAPKRKEGRQRGIDSFFNANTKVSPSKHNSKLASTLVQLVGDNSVDGPREGDAGHKLGSSSDVSSPMTKTTNASLKARPTIQKSKTAATTPPRGKKGGQQSIRSFFTPTKKDK